MEDIIQLENQIYIKASSSLADPRTRVVKSGEVFAIFDVSGDLKPIGMRAQGLYREATRYLSQFELKIGNQYPLFLSSTIRSDNTLFTADLSNPDLNQANGEVVHRGTFHIFRSKFLTDDACYEQIEITNFGNSKQSLEINLKFKSDFADMFEIRGIPRIQHGTQDQPVIDSSSVRFEYEGLDKIRRTCKLSFHPAPAKISESSAQFIINSNPQEITTLYITINCLQTLEAALPAVSFQTAFSQIESTKKLKMTSGCRLTASSERFNAWLNRSKSDIQLMLTQIDGVEYPYAGIPWFNSVFGRDGIITALQYLWIDPDLARGVLTYLAKYQSKENISEQDAEPGKILHEFRKGEMVETGEVPFKRYYGSADATPLFITLAGNYFDWTNDRPFIEALWPSIEAGLQWIDTCGDLDGDGFIEYQRRAPNGLANQGWKDSPDSVSHANGELAQGPIALAEVQGYVYEAKIQAAKIASQLGFNDRSEKLIREANILKTNFQKKFWNEELGTFVIALDGNKQQCKVKSSNAGHCLFSGIASRPQALKTAVTLLSNDMFSGWGIRTLSKSEIRYNPMSYHNGSIWPHDNAIIAEGFSRYGLKDEALKLITTLFDVSTYMDLYRLPELFCGFDKRTGEGPTFYPVACSPQAWAAGSVFMLLKACLGLVVDSYNNKISFYHPVLPNFLTDLSIKNLKTAHSTVDLLLRRHQDEISVYVQKRTGNVEINIIK
ncbi:MAG: amylo-alpha-1,6-glucosidase [Oligoflexia bacterium]|nr:amylo-alpha-1,6-glucosidase [Oligoflexia bacterium]